MFKLKKYNLSFFNDNKYWSQGTSIRFKEFEYSPIPGPGNYNVEGFADNLLNKNSKLVKYRESLHINSKKNSIEKKIINDQIDENQNETEN